MSLLFSTLKALEGLIEVGIWIQGIRDSDRTQSMRQKFLGAMVVAHESTTLSNWRRRLSASLPEKPFRTRQRAKVRF
jgi:hypothetical protein